MATTTTKLALTKPDGSDLVDIAVLNANADKIDAAAGATICTSTTRPASPWSGMVIYETDTNAGYVYRSSTTSWLPIASGATICTSSTRPSAPYAGQVIFETNTLKTLVYASSAWQEVVNSTAAKEFTSPTVANQTARDALFPSPVQGNSVFRSDKGYEERYFGLYNSGSNPGGRPAAGWYTNERNTGLVPITPVTVNNTGGSYSINNGLVTFSGVSSISLNGVFSATYNNYRLLLSDLLAGTGTSQITVRMRNAGADNSANTYYQLWTMKRLGGTFQDNTGGPNTGYTLVGYDNNSSYSWNWSGDVIAPFAAKNTTLTGQGLGVDGTGLYMLNSTVLHATPSSFDSITFYPTSSTMSGSIQILGYNY